MTKDFLYNNINFNYMQKYFLNSKNGLNIDPLTNDKCTAYFIDNITPKVANYKHCLILQTNDQKIKGIGLIAFSNNSILYYQIKRKFLSKLLKENRKNKFLDKITKLKFKWWLTDSVYRLKNNIFN